MDKKLKKATEIIEESLSVKRRLLAEMQDRIVSCAEHLVAALQGGNKILMCGNGGSAAEAQHFSSELIGKLWRVDRPAIRAIALTTDPCILTSLSNDFGFDECFVRQVTGLGKPGDVLIAITTSGNSPNIIRAVEAAREIGMSAIGFLGGDGGKVVHMVDDYVIVPSDATPRVQEGHHLLSHIFAAIIEEELYGKTA
jgi:D-sedoheptulose 7-phosphate isomerase